MVQFLFKLALKEISKIFTRVYANFFNDLVLIHFLPFTATQAVLVLWNYNDLLRFWFRPWKSFGSGSGSRPYLAQFSNNKKFVQNLAFSMSDAALFPKSWPLTYYYFIFLTF
jgi:hypothetical protein